MDLNFGVAVTSHDNSRLASATFEDVTIVEYDTYRSVDVGFVSDEGDATVGVDGAIVARGSYFVSNGMHHVYQEVVGDGDIRAKLRPLHPNNPPGVIRTTSAGVIALDSLTSSPVRGGLHTRRCCSDDSVSAFSPASGGILWSDPANHYQYLRMVRAGDQFRAYVSSDGEGWDLMQTQTVPLGARMYMGLFVSSGDFGELATAVFDYVQVMRP